MIIKNRTVHSGVNCYHSEVGGFSQISDDDAELLSGGVVQPSRAYDGSGSYGQRGQGFGPGNNPSTFYNGMNYGQAKQAEQLGSSPRNYGQAKKFG